MNPINTATITVQQEIDKEQLQCECGKKIKTINYKKHLQSKKCRMYFELKLWREKISME